MEKYYTPEISEFCFGLEYEILYEENIWKKQSVTPFSQAYFFEARAKKKEIRVKSLDREDIESVGWTKQSTSPNSINFTMKKTDLFLYFFTDSKEIIIDNGCSHESLDTFFQGTIRNISELKKLMKQLNIQTT